MMNLNMTIKILCVLLCGLALSACSKEESAKTKPARVPTVTAAQPRIENVERIISALGTLELESNVQVATEVAGLIREVKFEEGQEVRPGEVLVALDQTGFKLNLDKAQAALDRAQATLALAETNYQRASKLREKDLVPEQELQELATALGNAQSDLVGAQVNCRIAQRALDYSVIRAPVDESAKPGYTWEIQRKLVSIGGYLTAGAPVAELVNRSTLKLRFTVPEQEAEYLAFGKPARFTVPALPGKEFEARIFYIGPNAVESTRSVIVKARLDNPARLLRAGYSANVRLIGEAREQAVVIPRRSLRFDVDNPYVLIVNDGTLHKRAVVTGIEKDDSVEIISGVSRTDTVVVRAGSFLEEGTKVEIVKDK